MAAETKDFLVAAYFYETAPKIVEVYGVYGVEDEKADSYEYFDLYGDDGECMNEGDPMYDDNGEPPTRSQVRQFIKRKEIDQCPK